jgi:hypothetical protein
MQSVESTSKVEVSRSNIYSARKNLSVISCSIFRIIVIREFTVQSEAQETRLTKHQHKMVSLRGGGARSLLQKTAEETIEVDPFRTSSEMVILNEITSRNSGILKNYLHKYYLQRRIH